MIGAGAALQAAAVTAVKSIEGLNGAYPGNPIEATVPFAVVETGPETDWGHKSASGRELRLAVTLRDAGEAPSRMQALMTLAEQAVGSVEIGEADWHLVSFVFLRSRLVQDRSGGWAAVMEWRARMLAEACGD